MTSPLSPPSWRGRPTDRASGLRAPAAGEAARHRSHRLHRRRPHASSVSAVDLNICNGFSQAGSYATQVEYESSGTFVSVPKKGTIPASGVGVVPVTLDPGLLLPGTYRATLALTFGGGIKQVIVVPVTYDVQP
jgi:hypothetical protein